MKLKTMKLTTAFIAALFLVMGCAGGPKASSPDELDLAIRDASDYLNENIPKGSKIVILNVQSDSTALSDYIIDELIANAVNDKVFEVVDRQQLDLIRSEQNFQWSGEVDDKLALEVGKFFGAQTIVSGKVSQIAERYRFTIRALDVQSARVQGQNNFNIASGKIITALMNSKGGSSGTTSTASPSSAGGQGGQQAQPAQTAQPAQAAKLTAPANGTYYFYPRPRATKGGVNANAYLDRIIIRGGYLIVYLNDKPQGIGGMPAGGNYWYLTKDISIQDLDNPRLSWQGVDRGSHDSVEKGYSTVSFQGVTARRFSLTNDWDSPSTVFEEIDLSKAEYEP
jgi:TolB-like protein